MFVIELSEGEKKYLLGIARRDANRLSTEINMKGYDRCSDALRYEYHCATGIVSELERPEASNVSVE